MKYPETPELDKMTAALDSGKAAPVEEFLDWLLDDQGYTIVRFDHEGENPVAVWSREQLMRGFFNIDSDKAEAERDAVHRWLQQRNRQLDKDAQRERLAGGYRRKMQEGDTG